MWTISSVFAQEDSQETNVHVGLPPCFEPLLVRQTTSAKTASPANMQPSRLLLSLK